MVLNNKFCIFIKIQNYCQHNKIKHLILELTLKPLQVIKIQHHVIVNHINLDNH